jgi:UPF0755 protein
MNARKEHSTPIKKRKSQAQRSWLKSLISMFHAYRRLIIWTSASLFVVFCLGAAMAYYLFFAPNVNMTGKQSYLYIPTNSNYEEVIEIFRKNAFLENESTFLWTAQLLNYPNRVLPGRYRLNPGMGNLRLIYRLRSGMQEPVNLVLTSKRTKDHLAHYFSQHLQCSKEELTERLNNPSFLDSLGTNTDNVISYFIPNSYKVYWNITPNALMLRFKKEHDKFWTAERQSKAEALSLTPQQVMVLASIVQAETNVADEKPRVAGVYLNRLKNDWLLNADPTVIFAWQDFTIKRLYSKHTKIDNPFNTYKYKGLPPGPINSPTVSSIDAVLNPESHEYFYFCADPSLNGRHIFSTENEYTTKHLRVRDRYRDKMNELNINNSSGDSTE